jgi:LuxR family quorum sensing-dependent transcriptional regulator
MEEVLAALAQLDTCEAVLAVLMQFASGFGMDCVALGELPSEGVSRLPAFFYSTWPKEWFDIYVEHDLAARDPVVTTALHTLLPFTWSELRADFSRWRLTREHIRALDLIREFGWTEGFAVPVHGPDAYHGVVSFAGTPERLSMADRAALQTVSFYAHEHMRALHRAAAPVGGAEHEPLSEREIAAVRLMAAGRSDREIAADLGAAERTALYYIAAARRKLGCRTRAQLAAEAMRLGLIS